MLLEIHLRDFVLVREAALSLGPGLVCVTGETGAGKSLLVQALKLLAGQRGSPQLVRHGAEQAVVEAEFRPTPALQEELRARGLESDGGLLVRRIITASGKGRVFVNGVMVTLKELRGLMAPLLSIVGQHEYHRLFHPHRQRELLDGYGGLQKELARYAGLFRRLSSLREEVERLEARSQEVRRRRAEMEQELREIEAVDPRPGEDDELEQERRLLRSSKELRQLGEECYQGLYVGSGSVVELLDRCRRSLERVASLDPAAQSMAQEAESLLVAATELATDLRSYCDSIPTDLRRLEEIEERLYHLRQLMRRFGPGLDDVAAHRRRLQEALAGMEELEGRLEEARSRLEAAGREALEAARALSQARRRAAEELSRRISQELERLRMEGARLTVEVRTPAPAVDHLGPAGLDEVVFLFRPNPGHPPRPLAEIASGGELSRVLLTIHSMMEREAQGTLVFDEIDAGIGGGVAEVVGAKLQELARRGQVLAVTHFPQIAARAQTHIKVEKGLADGAAETTMTLLSTPEERRRELARMVGGGGEASERLAQELLEWR